MIGPSGDRVYNPARMADAGHAYGIIPSRRIAVVTIALTGFTAATTFRNVFLPSPRDHHFHWLLQVDSLLPGWAMLPVNVVFYALLVSICIGLFRAARGRERILVVGWLPGILLGHFKNALSASATDVINFFEVVGITVALVESVLILREYLPPRDSDPSGTSSNTVQNS